MEPFEDSLVEALDALVMVLDPAPQELQLVAYVELGLAVSECRQRARPASSRG